MGNKNKEQLLDLLHQLNEDLSKDGLDLVITVYGGFAMALYNLRTATVDIDAFCLSHNEREVQKYIDKIAYRNNIDRGWLNFGITQVIYNDLLVDEYKEWLKLSNIIINLCSKEQLLAMKCLSAREKDRVDIIALLIQTKIRSRRELEQLIKQFISSKKIREVNRARRNAIGRLLDQLEKEYFCSL